MAATRRYRLDTDRRVIRAEGEILARVGPVSARRLVAESRAVGGYGHGVLGASEIVPRGAISRRQFGNERAHGMKFASRVGEAAQVEPPVIRREKFRLAADFIGRCPRLEGRAGGKKIHEPSWAASDDVKLVDEKGTSAAAPAPGAPPPGAAIEKTPLERFVAEALGGKQ